MSSPARAGVRLPASSRPLLTAAGVGALGLLAGGIAAAISVNPKLSLTILIGVVVVSPIVIRLIQGKWDPFEPIMVMVVLFSLLYFLRPVAELAYGIRHFGNFTITESGFIGALWISLIGILSLYGGYALGLGRKVAAAIPPLPHAWDTAKSLRFVGWLLVVWALGTGFFAAIVGPGELFRFYLGRSNNEELTFLATSGYIAFSPYLVIPATIILLVAYQRTRSLNVGLLLATTLLISLYLIVPRGDRAFIIALVVPIVVLYYLRRERRPSGLAVVAMLALLVFAANIMLAGRFIEKRAERGNWANVIAQSVSDPLAQFEEFATGNDMTEFSIMALQYEAMNREADPLPEYPLATIKSILLGPLPLKITGDHGRSGIQFINLYLFDRQNFPASFGPGMLGDFFVDFRWVSLIAYCLFVGIALRALWEYFLRNGHNQGMQIVFAMSIPMIVIMVRNNLPDLIGRGAYFIVPLVLCLIFASTRDSEATAAHRA